MFDPIGGQAAVAREGQLGSDGAHKLVETPSSSGSSLGAPLSNQSQNPYHMPGAVPSHLPGYMLPAPASSRPFVPRRGKWTVRASHHILYKHIRLIYKNLIVIVITLLMQIEEERYTNKIIECFNAGTLLLPESAVRITLRAYLAEKLGCDPMRITKKYTGASCLGKRAYNPEVAKVSAETLQAVKEQLDDLEGKFRKKLEEKSLQEHQIIYSELKGSGGGLGASLPFNRTFYSNFLPYLYGSATGGNMMSYPPVSAPVGADVSSFYPVPVPMPQHLNMGANPFVDPAAAAAAAFEYPHPSGSRSPYVLVPREYLLAGEQQQRGPSISLMGEAREGKSPTQSSGDLSTVTTIEESEGSADAKSELVPPNDKEGLRRGSVPRDAKYTGGGTSASSLTAGSDDSTISSRSHSGSDLGIGLSMDDKAEQCESPPAGNQVPIKRPKGTSSAPSSSASHGAARKRPASNASNAQAKQRGVSAAPVLGAAGSRDAHCDFETVACLLGLSTSGTQHAAVDPAGQHSKKTRLT